MLRQPFVVPAILMAVVAFPLILGLIPRNRIYGIRTLKTLSDDHIWYRTNRFGGWALLGSSAVYLLVAALVPNPPPPQDSLLIWLLHLGAFIGPLILSLSLVRGYIKSL